MKTTIIILLAVFIIYSCRNRKEPCSEESLSISGVVLDTKGKPIDDAELSTQGRVFVTDKNGEFFMDCLKPESRIVVNVTKFGFGFTSKIYQGSAAGVVITLARATIKTINLNDVEGDSIVIEERNPDIQGPISSKYGVSNPLADIPFVYNEVGKLIGFEMPGSLQSIYNAISNFAPPVLGARVIIPKEGLDVNPDDRSVEASIQTIDIYSPDGMPGDFTVQLTDGGTGFMRSFGAVNFDIFSRKKPIGLKPKYRAKIVIPVDTLSILTKQNLPDEIPFLIYDAAIGRWQEEGKARLDRKTMMYSAYTTHFSSFNMDMVFGDASSCYQICNTISSIPFSDLRAEISVSDPGKTKTNLLFDSGCPLPGNCAPGSAHGIVNLRPFEPVGLRIFNANPTPTLVSSYVFITGDAITGTKDCSNSFNPCAGPVQIVDALDQSYTKSDKSGMCRPLLAIPLKTSLTNTNPLTIKLAWLYDSDFSVVTDQTTYIAQVSTIDSESGFVNFASIALTPNRLHNAVYSLSTFTAGTYYFRVLEAGSNSSNWVCITIDSMGTVSSCTSGNPDPPDCM